MEEQYNLMCTIAHLYLSLQVTVELCSKNLDANIGSQALKFINDFKLELQSNVESLVQLIEQLNGCKELQHLRDKIPNVGIDFCFHIDELKEKFCECYR